MKLLTEADVTAAIDGLDRSPPNDVFKGSLMVTIKKVVAAIRALPSADLWQGIESAPKEPVWIIGTDDKVCAPMIWQVECDDDEYTGWCGAVSVTGGLLYRDHVPLGFEPTKWQPMPAPPKGE